MSENRSGIGYDAHRLVPERKLTLGGVHIPHKYGLKGHSDGDVLIHAVIDSLLGAASLGDIGTHFPSTDPELCDVSSISLLRQTKDLVRSEGWDVVFLDATILAEKPRLSPYLIGMKSSISKVLGLACSNINVKSTTTDGLGFIGAEEGIASMAICTLGRSS
tara:strand:+ start:2564 stop:3049 length:486 start_codon:yes stop_codon:yes gene_type:complete